MNGFLLILILIVFLVPAFLQMRKQNQAMKQINAFRETLKPGMRVETAGGARGTIVAVRGEVADLEVAPGVVVEWNLQGILRPVSGMAPEPTVPDTVEGLDDSSNDGDTRA